MSGSLTLTQELNPADFELVPPGRIRRHPSGYWFFVPFNLPPPIELHWDLVNRLSEADSNLGRLDGAGRILADSAELAGLFIRREAMFSSRLGIPHDWGLEDLYAAEQSSRSGRVPLTVAAMVNCARTHEYGLAHVEESPLRTRGYLELHGRLLTGVNRSASTPGEFRHTSGWDLNLRPDLVDPLNLPPPPSEAERAFRDFDRYIHSDYDIPPLVRLALIHFQFAAISPFAEGNGRLGRILLLLLLKMEGLLQTPLLCLSAYFYRHAKLYRQLMVDVTTQARWIPWIEFFLKGVSEESEHSLELLARLRAIRATIERGVGGRKTKATTEVSRFLIRRPVFTQNQAIEAWGGVEETKRRLSLLLEANLISARDPIDGHHAFKCCPILEAME